MVPSVGRRSNYINVQWDRKLKKKKVLLQCDWYFKSVSKSIQEWQYGYRVIMPDQSEEMYHIFLLKRFFLQVVPVA